MSGPRHCPPRRRFLGRAGLIGLAAGTAGTAGCNVLLSPDPGEVAEALAGLLNDRPLAAELGRAFAASRPDMAAASLAGLVRTLAGRIGVDIDGAWTLRTGDLHRALARRVRDDFAEGEVETAAGWLVSRSEALLCAAVHRLDG